MITLLFLWIFFFLVFFGLGQLGWKLVLHKQNAHEPRSFFETIWFGIFLAILCLQLCALLLPLGKKALLILVVFSACGYWKQDKLRFASYKKDGAVLGLLMLPISFLALGDISWYDTGLYHLPAVKWLTMHGFVPGISWIHSRLGFNSSFHVLASVTESLWQPQRASHIALPMLFVLSLGHLIKDGLCNSENKKAQIFAAVLLPFLVTRALTSELSSLSTDGALYLSCTSLFLVLLSPTLNLQRLWTLLALSLVTFSFKLTGVPLLLVCMVCGVAILRSARRMRNIRIAVMCVASVVLLAIGYVLRNIVHTGWVLYPWPHFSVPVEWKESADRVIDLGRWIASWARIPRKSPNEVLDSGFWHWFSQWARVFFKRPEAYVLAVTLLLTPFRKMQMREWGIWLLCLIAISYWFITAPDLRFAAVYFWVFFAVTLASRDFLFSRFSLAVIFVCLLAVQIATTEMRKPQHTFHIFRIPAAPQGDVIEVKFEQTGKLGAVTFYKPNNDDRCYDAPLVCSPEPTLLFERVPGNERKGFVRR